MGGDSGGPSFAVVNGQLALLGEHFSNWGTCGQAGPPVMLIPRSSTAASWMATPTQQPREQRRAWWWVNGFVPDYVSTINAQMAADPWPMGSGAANTSPRWCPSRPPWP